MQGTQTRLSIRILKILEVSDGKNFEKAIVVPTDFDAMVKWASFTHIVILNAHGCESKKPSESHSYFLLVAFQVPNILSFNCSWLLN